MMHILAHDPNFLSSFHLTMLLEKSHYLQFFFFLKILYPVKGHKWLSLYYVLRRNKTNFMFSSSTTPNHILATN